MLAHLLLAATLGTAPAAASDPAAFARAFARAIQADDLRAFDASHRSSYALREVVERFDCPSVAAAYAEPSADGFVVHLYGTAVTAGAPRREVRLPERWHVTAKSVQRGEDILAKRLVAHPDARLLVDANDVDLYEVVHEAAQHILERDRQCGPELLELAQWVGDLRAEAYALRMISRFVSPRSPEIGLATAQRTLEVARAAGHADSIAEALFVHATAHWGSSQPDEAIAHFVQSADLIDQLDDPRIALKSLHMAAHIESRRRNHAGAIVLADRGERLAKQYGWREGEMNAYFVKGGAYGAIGRPALATQFHRRAYETAKAIGNGRAAAVGASNVAITEIAHGRYDAAEKLFAEAVKGFAVIDREAAHVSVAVALVRMEQYDRVAPLMEFVTRAADAGDRLLAANANMVLSALALHRGEYEEALRRAHRAAGAPEIAAGGITSGIARWHAHTLAGLALQKLGRDADAEDALRAAIDDIESERLGVLPAGLALSRFIRRRDEPYRLLAEMLLARGEVREALRVADAIKGRTLRELVGRSHAEVVERLPEDDRALESAASAELERLNRELAAATSEEERKRLRRERGAARQRLEDVGLTLAMKYPRLHVAGGGRLDLDAIPAGTAVISYLLGETTSHAFVVRRGDVRVVPIPHGRSALEAMIRDGRARIAKRDLRYATSARQLHEVLLGPLVPMLRGATSLVIVPDGALWRLPFVALIDDRYPISYSPSVAALSASRADGNAQGLLAFGSPAIASAPPLAAARTELDTLQRLYGAETIAFRGAAAREGAFKQNASRARVIHVATHAEFERDAPLHAALVFSDEPDGSAEDGRLETREIVELPLDADLAVLSACNTALGDFEDGEGVIGLAWAFLAAGARTTVVSQWEVASAPTAKLMISFHRHRLAGHPPAEALRRAQTALRAEAEYRQPFYWAGFMVVGTP